MARAIRRIKIGIHGSIGPERLSRDLSNFEEVILFGSRAAKVGRRGSDWDLLCVGKLPPRRVYAEKPIGSVSVLDVIWLPPEVLHTSEWLGSELANHVKHFGVVLRGAGEWREKAVTSEVAVVRKVRVISVRCRVILQYGSYLAPKYLEQHKRLLRRDLQRLDLLRKNVPVPPSVVLDDAWSSDANTRIAACETARMDLLTSRAPELLNLDYPAPITSAV